MACNQSLLDPSHDFVQPDRVTCEFHGEHEASACALDGEGALLAVGDVSGALAVWDLLMRPCATSRGQEASSRPRAERGSR